MPLTNATRSEIQRYLTGELTRYITENASAKRALDEKPFHARLLPALFKANLSERSFSTRSGTWWQQISRLIARQYHLQAELQYRIVGQIKPAAAQHIDEIIRQLNIARQRAPIKKLDIYEVCTVQSPGGDTLTVQADLYVLTREHQEMYFEIKGATPNKDASMAVKRFILRSSALLKGRGLPRRTAQLPTTLTETVIHITWSYARQFLEIGEDLLVGREFWAKIGDDQTYDELLEISESVGKQITEQIAAIQ